MHQFFKTVILAISGFSPADNFANNGGDVIVVECTVCDIPCIVLNGSPSHRHSEAFSLQIATDDQAETDRYWNAIVGNGVAESACGCSE